MQAAKYEQGNNDRIDRGEALRRVRNLIPLCHLTDAEFGTIASTTEVETCAVGRDLFRAGQDDPFIFYLLSGEITVTSADGDSYTIAGGTIETRHPLRPHRRDRVRATARTTLQYVRFPVDLMRLHEKPMTKSVEVEEIQSEDDELDHRVMFDVYHLVMSEDLVLPTLPDVALRIREVAGNRDADAEMVARIIRADPSTTAYCIKVANSAAVAGHTKIDNVLDAVVRLGIEPVRDLVIAYTMRSLFDGASQYTKKLMRKAWAHSCRIGALSFILARDVGRLNPERALLAGLLHDIGITVLIKQSEAHKQLQDDPVIFDHLCHDMGGQIGAMVLRAWKFPDVFVESALEAEHFSKPVAERIQLADVVMLAHLHDREPAPWSLAAQKLADLSIHDRLRAYDLTEDSRLAVLEEAEHEMEEITLLLNG